MWQSPDHDPKIVERSEEKAGNPRVNYIALAGQITRGKRNFDPKADNLWVTSRWNEEQGIYYLVEFHNRFLSTDPEYPDAVAIQWPAKLQDLFGAEKPYFIFGDSKKPVDIWKASFMAKDYNPAGAPNPAGYQLDVTVEELNGNGFEDVMAKDETTVQVVDSIFHQGRVKVLFKRALKTEGEMDVQIPVEQFIPVSFMQWAGDDKETDENMAISTWYYTILEPAVDQGHILLMAGVMGTVFVGLQGWLVWMTKRTRKMYSDGKVKQDELPF
jgi:hypothetical protein